MEEIIQIERFGSLAQHIRPSPHRPDAAILIPTMDNSIGAQLQVADVKFFPPLHEQRRSWALEILRRERVTSVRALNDDEIASVSN
jgi:hypothetical protein